MRLSDCGPMVGCAREIRIGKCNSSERCGAQNGTWWGIAAFPEKETRLWAHVCVAPAIEDNPRDVASRIKSRSRENVCTFSADLEIVYVILRWMKLSKA